MNHPSGMSDGDWDEAAEQFYGTEADMLTIQRAGGYWCIFYGDIFVNSYHSEDAAKEKLYLYKRAEAERIRHALFKL